MISDYQTTDDGFSILSALPDGLTDEELFANLPQLSELSNDIKDELKWSCFEEADVALCLFAQRQNFAIKITHTAKFPGQNLVRHRVYACTQGGTYKPKKVASLTMQRDKTSH